LRGGWGDEPPGETSSAGLADFTTSHDRRGIVALLRHSAGPIRKTAPNVFVSRWHGAKQNASRLDAVLGGA